MQHNIPKYLGRKLTPYLKWQNLQLIPIGSQTQHKLPKYPGKT